MKKILFVAVVFAMMFNQPATAGGFAAREQSAEFHGMSYAGNATSGGGISGMFWNPAIIAYAPATINVEGNIFGIFAKKEISGNVYAGNINIGLPSEGGNIADTVILPSGYMSIRAYKDLVFGLSINAPFRQSNNTTHDYWAGQTFSGGRRADIKSLNVTPVLGYKILPSFSIGIGFQIERMDLLLKDASGITAASRDLVTEGDSTGFGFTVGVNWTPVASTSVGLGYRSFIDHSIEGSISIPGSPVPPAASGVGVKAKFTSPDIVTASIRHQMTEKVKVLATVEWSNWSRMNSLDFACSDTSPNPVFCPAGNGQLVRSTKFDWHDGWYVSGGLEYAYSPALTLRTGVGYEWSPMQDVDERWLGSPDKDSLSISVGASYSVIDRVAIDFAYSHAFGISSGQISRSQSGLTFIGNVSPSADIVSLGLKARY